MSLIEAMHNDMFSNNFQWENHLLLVSFLAVLTEYDIIQNNKTMSILDMIIYL